MKKTIERKEGFTIKKIKEDAKQKQKVINAKVEANQQQPISTANIGMSM